MNLTKNRFERSIALSSEIASFPKFQGYVLMTAGFPIASINFEHLKREKSLFNYPSYLAYS